MQVIGSWTNEAINHPTPHSAHDVFQFPLGILHTYDRPHWSLDLDCLTRKRCLLINSRGLCILAIFPAHQNTTNLIAEPQTNRSIKSVWYFLLKRNLSLSPNMSTFLFRSIDRKLTPPHYEKLRQSHDTS